VSTTSHATDALRCTLKTLLLSAVDSLGRASLVGQSIGSYGAPQITLRASQRRRLEAERTSAQPCLHRLIGQRIMNLEVSDLDMYWQVTAQARWRRMLGTWTPAGGAACHPVPVAVRSMAAMRVIQSYLKEADLQSPLSHGESEVDIP
nr:hypothetical protein [Tanacetum cinerariifolium]